MRGWLTLLIVVTIGTGGYILWRQQKSQSPINNASTSVRHIAPEGVYYTLKYFSVPTAFGITGIPPGTKVIRVKDQGATVRVKTGDVEFDAPREQLTNDLDLAARIATSDAIKQNKSEQAASDARSAAAARQIAEYMASDVGVQIFWATYGFGNTSIDVTERIRLRILNGERTISASNQLAGDPFPGKTKTLSISYSAGNGVEYVNLREGQSITFPAGPPVRRLEGYSSKLNRGAYDQKDNVARPPEFFVPPHRP